MGGRVSVCRESVGGVQPDEPPDESGGVPHRVSRGRSPFPHFVVKFQNGFPPGTVDVRAQNCRNGRGAHRYTTVQKFGIT